jgi:hypothetical protein
MVAQELLHQQRALAPKQDLSKYKGQWVVLRDGRVVDHDMNMQALIERGLLSDRDSVIRVSSLDGSFAF